MDERLPVQPTDDVAAECLSRIVGGNGANNESAAHRREHDELEVFANLRIRTPETHAGTTTIVDDEDTVRRDVFLNVPLEVEKLIDIPVGVLPHPHENRRRSVDGGQKVPVLIVPVRTEIVEYLDEREGIAELQARVIELPVVLSADRQEKFAKAEKALNRTARLSVAPPCVEEDNLQEHRPGTMNHIRTGNELFAAVVLVMVQYHLPELMVHRDISSDIEDKPDGLVVETVVFDLFGVRATDSDVDVRIEVTGISLKPDDAQNVVGMELSRVHKNVHEFRRLQILEDLAENLGILSKMLVEIDDAGNVLVVSHGNTSSFRIVDFRRFMNSAESDSFGFYYLNNIQSESLLIYAEITTSATIRKGVVTIGVHTLGN